MTDAMRPVSLGFRTDIALLELGGSLVERHDSYLVVRSPHAPTFWWGNFLLVFELPTDPQPWLDRFAVAFPESSHLTLGVDVTAGVVDDLRGFTSYGCDVDASAVMTASAVHPPAHRHAGAECRSLVSDEDWAQSISLSLRAYDGNDPDSQPAFAASRARTNRGLVEAGHGAWFGAFLDGRLVAQLGLLRAHPGLARFQSVETDPQFRRLGLAGTLVYDASRYGFDRLGAHTLVMVADPDYFAIDLYRNVGFSVTETQLQVQRSG